MQFQDFLAVFGVFVSLSFGAWGVYLALRKKKYPGELSFFEESCIGLFDEIVGSLSDLFIAYKEADVKHNLVLLKGYLFNSGSIDISSSMTNKQLSAVLPQDFKWLEAKVVKKSPNINCLVHIVNDTCLNFEIDLIRRNECIYFEALAEAPNPKEEGESVSKYFRKSISWDHRITDTAEVNCQNLPSENRNRNKKRNIFRKINIVIICIMGIMFPTMLLTGILPSNSIQMHYFTKVENGKEIQVKIKPMINGMATVKAIDGNWKIETNLREFVKSNELKPVVYESYFSKWADYLFVFMMPVMAMLMIFLESSEYLKRRKILALLQKGKIEPNTLINRTK